MDKHKELLDSVGSQKNEFTEMLEGMTKQELVKYANMTFGLSLTAKFTKPDLITAIQDSRNKFGMNADLTTEEQIEEGGLQPGYADIQLHRTEMTKGMKSVIVGLNGNMASLPIGVRFGCPLELLEILKNSIRIEYEQDMTVDPPELVEREVHSYPFTIFDICKHTPESEARARKTRGFNARNTY